MVRAGGCGEHNSHNTQNLTQNELKTKTDSTKLLKKTWEKLLLS